MKAAGPERIPTQDVADALCRVEMLGGLSVIRGGECVTRFARQKAGALLSYLALFAGLHPRECLLDLFWPDMDLPEGRDNLSTALASLRRQIEPQGVRRGSVLQTTHAHVGLNGGALMTDVADFERLLDRAGRLDMPAPRVTLRREALALYRGALLPGCYEDWAVREADRLETRLVGALADLAADQESLGALSEAVETAHRRVDADPYSEDAHHQLIRLSVLAGRPQAARDAWSRFEQTFAQEFGTQPSPQIQRQVEQLLATPFRLAPPPAPLRAAPVSPVSVAPPAVRPSVTPVVLSRFFGRQSELNCLVRLLLPKDWTEGRDGPEPPCRLVTLTGPGGIGKTRLALELARRVGERVPAWCGFAGLADATAPDQVAGRIASALGLAATPDLSPLEQVAAFFGVRDSLGAGPSVLVLDNLEHLLFEEDPDGRTPVGDAAEVVRMLLERAPSLSILCTSRRRLGLRGERVVPVTPLPVPASPSGELSEEGLAALAASPSVRLYLDRAQAVRPDFGLSPANAPAVAALCRQLEGSPLALELAAAWVRTLPPRKMWERLTAGQDVPAGSYGDLPPRHRSLTAALEWSWRLLPPAQQRLWARLSVFRGGWTVEAAEAGGGEPEAAALLARLAEASLVTVSENEAGDVRYGFLETVRAFGWARLGEGEGCVEACRRHAAYFGALAEEAAPELRGPAQAEWLERLAADHDNLRAALERCLAREGAGTAEPGLRVAVALSRFWIIRGHWAEGERWLALCLAHPGAADLPPALRAKALNTAARFARLHGDVKQAETLFEQSLALRRQIGDLAGVSDTLHNLGFAALGQGDLLRARALYEESLSLCRGLGDLLGTADELHHLGLVAQEEDDLPRAKALYEESLAVRRPLGDERGLSYTLHNLGNLAFGQNDSAQARALHEESLAIRRRLGDSQGIADSLLNLGALWLAQGYDQEADTLFAECLPLFRQLGDRPGIAAGLEGLAALALAVGAAERGGRLFGAASSLRDALGLPLSAPACAAQEQTLAAVQSGPLASAFASAWEYGRRLDWEQAVEYASRGG